jgi:hypothetical protein
MIIKSKLERLSKPGEKWAQVSEGYYISDQGRWYSAGARKILKQIPNRHGYMRAWVAGDKNKAWLTHLMVIRHFGDRFGNFVCPGQTLREQGLSVDHVNGNKRNNKVSNLEIVPHAENVARYYATFACAAEGDLPY